jgi:S-formylglutathione hydrolase FrmB
VPGRSKLDTWLTKDVRQMVLNNFRVADDPASWGAIGYSTGGFCAVKLAVQHSDLFRSAVSIAGDDFAGAPGPFLGDPRTQQENSPLALLRDRPAPPVSLLLFATEDDKDCPAQLDRTLEAAVRPPTMVAHQFAAHGGHTGSVWKKFQPAAFVWLGQHLQVPA